MLGFQLQRRQGAPIIPFITEIFFKAALAKYLLLLILRFLLLMLLWLPFLNCNALETEEVKGHKMKWKCKKWRCIVALKKKKFQVVHSEETKGSTSHNSLKIVNLDNM